MKFKCNELIRKNYVQPSTSAYRANVMLVQHADKVKAFLDKHGENAAEALMDPALADIICGFYRLTIDYRLLNKETIPDRHPLPRVLDILESFWGDEHFSAFDLENAFWSVTMSPEDRHKTAFSTHLALLEWIVMPQGSSNAAAAFARIIGQAFENLHEEIRPYQDDIFLGSKTFAGHIERLQLIYDKLRETCV
jgi:hypothetical protein